MLDNKSYEALTSYDAQGLRRRWDQEMLISYNTHTHTVHSGGQDAQAAIKSQEEVLIVHKRRTTVRSLENEGHGAWAVR